MRDVLLLFMGRLEIRRRCEIISLDPKHCAESVLHNDFITETITVIIIIIIIIINRNVIKKEAEKILKYRVIQEESALLWEMIV